MLGQQGQQQHWHKVCAQVQKLKLLHEPKFSSQKLTKVFMNTSAHICKYAPSVLSNCTFSEEILNSDSFNLICKLWSNMI